MCSSLQLKITYNIQKRFRLVTVLSNIYTQPQRSLLVTTINKKLSIHKPNPILKKISRKL